MFDIRAIGTWWWSVVSFPQGSGEFDPVGVDGVNCTYREDS